MRKFLSVPVLAMSLCFASPAAASTWCSGSLDKSYLQSDGAVIVETSWSGWTQVCNLKTEWKGITPDICAGWLARTDAAVSLNLSVQFSYTETYSACGQVPLGSAAPAPLYIMLI